MSNTLFFAVLVTLLSFSASLEYFRNIRDTVKTCASGVNGYCSDCDHTVLCNGNVISTETACAVGQVCQEISTYSSCVDSYNVPECECPPTGQEVVPDIYDDDRFILCDNGARHIEECTSNEFFNTDTKKCERIPTTTPETTIAPITRSPKCLPDTFDIVQVTCSQYQICYSDNTQSDVTDCKPGYIFNDDTEECEFYTLFTCSDKPDGLYADTHNCSIYYLCISGAKFGSPSVCPTDTLFDNTAQTCVTQEDSKCEAVVDCGICSDAETYIEIDCNNFYKCEENTEEGGLPYIPVLSTCPEGTCFDLNTTFCEILARRPKRS